MNFSTDGHLWIPVALVILLGYFYCFVTAEEPCYRGDAHLDYDNPCSDESGQPSKLSFCFRGMRLADRCTENCVYCDEGTYQDKFTNCSTCLPCTTAEDCPSGQVLIEVCTTEENAVCGCPDPPPCPTCESCPAVPPCPTVTPCPVQTECPACEWPTNAPVTTGPQEAIKLMFIRACPANILAGPLSGSETKTVHWREPQATDAATIVQSHHPGDRFFAGNTTVVYVFKTEEHSIDCSFVVTVSEETFIPTTPSRRDEASEASTPESGKSDFQVGSDIRWILLIFVVSLMGVLNLILSVCLILCCCKNQQKVTLCQGPPAPNAYFQAPVDGQLHQPPGANLDVPPGEYPAHQPVAARALNEYQRGERGDIELDPLGQNMPSPGNNNIPTNDGGGAEGGSATTSDASSNRGLELDQPQQNTPPPGNSLDGAVGGDGRNASTTSYTGSNREYGRLHSTDQSPARGTHRLMSTDQPPHNADVNSDEMPMSTSGGAIEGDDVTDSRTPLLPSQSQSSSLPYQRNPEQLIFDETKRNSPVLEIEMHWIAAMVTKHYPHQHEILYGRLNITENAVNKIRIEKVQNNPIKSLEDEIFKILNYGWRQKESSEQEETRAHLTKQLDTFDKKLAEAYANYINNCNDFSIMGSV